MKSVFSIPSVICFKGIFIFAAPQSNFSYAGSILKVFPRGLTLRKEIKKDEAEEISSD